MRAPRLSVFIAASLDGFIATADGRLDWVEAAARPDEDNGYEGLMATVDALAMGRGTYDHIAHLDPSGRSARSGGPGSVPAGAGDRQ